VISWLQEVRILAVSEENTRVIVTITKEDDELLEKVAAAMRTSKSKVLRDMFHEFAEFLREVMEGNEGNPDAAIRKMVRLGMVRIGDSLSNLLK